MGKGVGMVAARQATTGKVVHAALVDSSAAPFVCLGCGVPVVRVSGHWIHKADPELAREVHAFFRLKPGDDNQHSATCPFTPAGQVKILVDEAEAVEDSANPFERRPNGSVVFRLNIADEEVRREGTAEPLGQSTDIKTRVERVWSGRRLDAYCRSAVGLAKLWQTLEGPDAQAELKRCVRIEQSGRQVPWEDFFFPPERIRRFADRFESDRFPPPVAMLLHAREFTQSREGRLSLRFSPIPDPDASTDTRIAVRAYGEERVLRLLQTGRHYVVFGPFWRGNSSPWTPPGKAVTITYRNFGIKLFRPSQVAEIDVVDPRGNEDSGL